MDLQRLRNLVDACYQEFLEQPGSVPSTDWADRIIRRVVDKEAGTPAPEPVDRIPASYWQSIDTAPRDGICVLLQDAEGIVYMGQWDKVTVANGEYEDWCLIGQNGTNLGRNTLTHWMPLPGRKAPEPVDPDSVITGFNGTVNGVRVSKAATIQVSTVDPDTVDGLIARLQALPADVRKLPAVVYTDNGVVDCNPQVMEVDRNEFVIQPEGRGPFKVAVL